MTNGGRFLDGGLPSDGAIGHKVLIVGTGKDGTKRACRVSGRGVDGAGHAVEEKLQPRRSRQQGVERGRVNAHESARHGGHRHLVAWACMAVYTSKHENRATGMTSEGRAGREGAGASAARRRKIADELCTHTNNTTSEFEFAD